VAAFPCVNELHRSAGLPSQESEENLHGDVFLASKSTADHGAANANAVLRHIQRTSDGAEVLDHLRTNADIDDSLFVDPRYAAIRFQIGVLHERHGERVLHDHVGLGHAGVEIAFANLVLGHHIVGCK